MQTGRYHDLIILNILATVTRIHFSFSCLHQTKNLVQVFFVQIIQYVSCIELDTDTGMAPEAPFLSHVMQSEKFIEKLKTQTHQNTIFISLYRCVPSHRRSSTYTTHVHTFNVHSSMFNYSKLNSFFPYTSHSTNELCKWAVYRVRIQNTHLSAVAVIHFRNECILEFGNYAKCSGRVCAILHMC